MTVRKNIDGTVAAIVNNYNVACPALTVTRTLSVDAAVVQDQRWRVSVNAIEFSKDPGGGVSFAKFYNFNAVSGARALTVDLDGRGQKAVPSACIVCHGGRGDPLTPPDATGKPLFPLVVNSVSLQRGDTEARLLPFEVGHV